MGRRTVISTSGLNLVNPSYSQLLSTRSAFLSAENDFYNDRRDELNEYPGLSGLSSSQVEQAYDNLLGNEPWNYTSIFTASANQRKVPPINAITFGVSVPTTLGARIPGASETFLGYTIQYTAGEGQPEVDLLYTDIELFGPSKFTEVPTAYQDNSLYDGRKAHMYRLIGSLYDSALSSAWNSYSSALNNYRSWGGSGASDFIAGSGSTPWSGYIGDVDAGYNRPSKLKGKLIRETRGAN